VTARIVGAGLSEMWGQQVVIDNKPGAAGNVAAEYVARSAPDGYTLYIASFSHATNRFLYPALNYDPVTDFSPVTLIGIYPNIMVVPNSSPARTVAEFIDFARANKVSFASSGHGTSLHLAGESAAQFRREVRQYRDGLEKALGKVIADQRKEVAALGAEVDALRIAVATPPVRLVQSKRTIGHAVNA